MERTLGADFGDVRIHDGVAARAAVRRLDADAYATERDVVLGTTGVATDVDSNRLLLGHELAHVAQFQRAEGESETSGVTDRRDPAEQEAAEAGVEAASGESVQVSETPTAAVATGALGWLEQRASDLGSMASGAVSSVGSMANRTGAAITRAASTVPGGANDAEPSTWQTVKNAYWGTVDEGARMMEEAGGPLNAIYQGMQSNAESLRDADAAMDRGITGARQWVANRAQGLADYADGIPVVEQGADLWASSINRAVSIPAGALQGLTTMGTDVVSMGANPVDTVLGLEKMAAQVPMSGVNPIRAGRKIRQYALGTGGGRGVRADLIEGSQGQGERRRGAPPDRRQGLAGLAHEIFSPQARMRDRQQFSMQMAGAIADQYNQSLAEGGNWWQVGGRAGFDIVSTIGTGGMGAASTFGTASKFGRAGSAGLAGRAGQAGRAGRAGRAGTAGRAGSLGSTSQRLLQPLRRLFGDGGGPGRGGNRANVDAPRLGNGRPPELVESRIPNLEHKHMTTDRALNYDGRLRAGEGSVSYKGNEVTSSSHGWRDEAGQFAEGPYSIRSSRQSTQSSGAANPSYNRSTSSMPEDPTGRFTDPNLHGLWSYRDSVPDFPNTSRVQQEHVNPRAFGRYQRTPPDGTPYYDSYISKAHGEKTLFEQSGPGQPHRVKSSLELEFINNYRNMMEAGRIGELPGTGAIMQRMQEITRQVRNDVGGFPRTGVDTALISHQNVLHSTGPRMGPTRGAARSLRQTRAEMDIQYGRPGRTNVDIDAALRALEEDGLLPD